MNNKTKENLSQNSLLQQDHLGSRSQDDFEFMEFDSKLIDISDKNIIGVDETGVGDYFGPLVAAAVMVPKEKIQLMKELNVRDSKEIKSEKQLFFLYKKIKENCYYRTYTLSNKGYNTLYNSLENSNKLKYFVHSHAINNLEEELKEKSKTYDYILIDQYSTINAFRNYKEQMFLNNNWSGIKNFQKKVLTKHKAENLHVSVACASIVARVTLTQKMNELSSKYNFEFSLGAGKKVKNQVLDFKAKFGEEKLSEVCKMHFKIDEN